MKLNQIAILGVLTGLMSSGIATAANTDNTFEGFSSIGSVEELLSLPDSELCSDGGPTSDEIKLILLNGPLAVHMYSNDPSAANLVIQEQTKNIKKHVMDKCATATTDKPFHRWESIKMLKSQSERDVCANGAPTREELEYLMRNDKQFNTKFDKDIQNFPPDTRMILEEGAKLHGMSLREAMLSDILTATTKNWKTACDKLATSPSLKADAPASNSTSYQLSDQKLNETWRKLDADTRKRLLPQQRLWIKQKDSICKTDTKCLTDMTNDRINELNNSVANGE